jgi:glutamine amidotransferase-like uncharacterized protein
MREQLAIKEVDQVEVRTMRQAPWGTQSAIVVLPRGYVVKDGGGNLDTSQATVRRAAWEERCVGSVVV